MMQNAMQILCNSCCTVWFKQTGQGKFADSVRTQLFETLDLQLVESSEEKSMDME